MRTRSLLRTNTSEEAAMPTYTTNKQIIKPNNGEYPNTWNVPVNTDWDIIDKALGSAFSVDVTSSDATPNAEACQNQRIDVTGFPNPAIRYVSFPATIGGMWIVDNKSNGTIRVTVVGSATYLVLATTKRAIIFSDGTNASFADDVRLVQGTGITVSGDTISLTSPVTTTLGGTGQTSYTNGQLLIGNGSGSLTKATLTAGTNVTITNGDGAITINSTSGGGGTGITSLTLSGGLTGLLFTPNTLTASGTMTLSGTLGVANGGTGVTSLTGYVVGNGSGAFTASATIPTTALTGTIAIANGGTGASDAGTARTNLGLGTMATQAASAVAITGGSITATSGSLTGLSSLRVSGQSYEAIGNGTLNVNANTSFFQSGTGLTHSASGTSNFTTTNTTFRLESGITPQAFGTTVWVNISDARIKTDVTPYGLGTAALNQLRPVNYIYNGEYGTPDGGPVQTGLIAQEVLTTQFASMVGTRVYEDPNTGVETTLYDVNTNQLVFALINAVKELSARISVLEAK